MAEIDNNDDVIKVDLSQKSDKPSDDVVKVDLRQDPSEQQEAVEETAVEEPAATEEVTTEEVVEEVVNEQPQQQVVQQELPEAVQKLMEFIEDTGGSIQDYVNLNLDLDSFDNLTLLREYYKQTQSHLDSDEIDFMIDDQFSYDEEVDEESAVRRKKLDAKKPSSAS